MRQFLRWRGKVDKEGFLTRKPKAPPLGSEGFLTTSATDADGSGTVDIVDLNTVLIDWGK